MSLCFLLFNFILLIAMLIVDVVVVEGRCLQKNLLLHLMIFLEKIKGLMGMVFHVSLLDVRRVQNIIISILQKRLTDFTRCSKLIMTNKPTKFSPQRDWGFYFSDKYLPSWVKALPLWEKEFFLASDISEMVLVSFLGTKMWS